MYFDSFAEFLAMGRHGPYVWSAYGICALLIVINMVLAARKLARVRQDVARQWRRETREVKHESGS
ncbi:MULTISPECIES: heme exporter protein CcmD [Alcanivoracaceae]|jgi:heme exporter protein D|uniref:Heme exporter protein D n=3 Tax=Alcanivoracaceae TaxID=224372 RepID=A0A9Q3W8Y8_9GAMM|nr:MULTISPECIES: heme exporter protein CcmD [Alcanivoracaceae]ERS15002.1 hemagglutination activity protein [Alcanivorax sp. PN-3]KYZ87087.1 hemagglutination activity protein [Alcanivorax sp. KX64203]MBA4723360.1 heme exporter protein CcmD [Alcanivorax sp.]ARB45271.1 hemagglutination activity protein [Alloalcanivorax xenomutans]KAF0803023.1 heme exporter protein D [Alcanivorax xiamenensis]|tara:strand:+ start:1488 stop:1685 length:198 start_codon:yes stop_codon:yes gene_type:complete